MPLAWSGVATILYDSTRVHRGIKELFSHRKRRRVAIVAFVGSSAHAYLGNPKGLELVCWPRAGATNAETIRHLKDCGAKVHFCDNLHAKLYWCEGIGAIVTSANLSTNALGTGRLREFGLRVTSQSIDIDRVLNSLPSRRVTEADLRSLEREQKKLLEMASMPPTHEAISDFGQWFKTNPRAPWKLGLWWNWGAVPKTVREVLKRERGSTQWTQMQSAPAGDIKKNQWLLSVRLRGTQIGSIEWIQADYVVKIPRSDPRFDAEMPYELVQVSPQKTYCQPPFKINAAFRAAFRVAARDFGIDKLEHRKSLRVPSGLVDGIERAYVGR